MNPSFWYAKRVLLTGHTGFKGSWLALWLESLGAKVVGYALAPPTEPNLFEVAELGVGLKSVIGDVRDLEKLQAVLNEHRPEIVIHMAAQPLVRQSYAEPVETYSTNIMGTVNLLEAVRHVRGVKAVLNITTDKCYQNQEWIWPYREDEPLGGYDPYSSSKSCSELVTAAYRSSFFNPDNYSQHGVAVATARAGNVIGGGDWAADRLIPDILGAFERNQPVKIRNPKAVRPWQHVLEPLCGYLMLVEHMYEEGPPYGEAWNFGPREQDAKSVGWIVGRMIKHWGDGASSVIDGDNYLHEATFLKLDISKACSRLRWSPVLNLDDALKLIVHWSKQRLGGADVRKLSLAQISAYQKLVEKK